MLLECSFVFPFRSTGNQRRKKNDHHASFVFARFIIVKCSLKCNIFCVVTCFMCRDEMGLQFINHRASLFLSSPEPHHLTWKAGGALSLASGARAFYSHRSLNNLFEVHFILHKKSFPNTLFVFFIVRSVSVILHCGGVRAVECGHVFIFMENSKVYSIVPPHSSGERVECGANHDKWNSDYPLRFITHHYADHYLVKAFSVFYFVLPFHCLNLERIINTKEGRANSLLISPMKKVISVLDFDSANTLGAIKVLQLLEWSVNRKKTHRFELICILNHDFLWGRPYIRLRFDLLIRQETRNVDCYSAILTFHVSPKNVFLKYLKLLTQFSIAHNCNLAAVNFFKAMLSYSAIDINWYELIFSRARKIYVLMLQACYTF